MFHQNIQAALNANCDIPDLVGPGDMTTAINIFRDELPCAIESMSQVGTVKVFFGHSRGQANQPMRQTFEYRHLVPGGSPVDETKRMFLMLNEDG